MGPKLVALDSRFNKLYLALSCTEDMSVCTNKALRKTPYDNRKHKYINICTTFYKDRGYHVLLGLILN